MKRASVTLPDKYHEEANWAPAYRVAERAAEAGLGVTAHAGEVGEANIEAALGVPRPTRIGHAVAAAGNPRLLEMVAESGVTVESCLRSNVVLGAIPSYEEHPVRRFIEASASVALCIEDPVRVCTKIGREYALAAAVGFSEEALPGFAQAAVRASFAPADRRAALLLELQGNGGGSPT